MLSITTSIAFLKPLLRQKLFNNSSNTFSHLKKSFIMIMPHLTIYRFIIRRQGLEVAKWSILPINVTKDDRDYISFLGFMPFYCTFYLNIIAIIYGVTIDLFTLHCT